MKRGRRIRLNETKINFVLMKQGEKISFPEQKIGDEKKTEFFEFYETQRRLRFYEKEYCQMKENSQKDIILVRNPQGLPVVSLRRLEKFWMRPCVDISLKSFVKLDMVTREAEVEGRGRFFLKHCTQGQQRLPSRQLSALHLWRA